MKLAMMKLTILLAFGLFHAARGAETPKHETGRACFDHKVSLGVQFPCVTFTRPSFSCSPFFPRRAYV